MPRPRGEDQPAREDENSRKKLHGRCLELLGALTMTRARVHELETLLYLKHMDKEVGLPSPFAHFSDC